MNEDCNDFRVIICGSREFDDYDLLKEKCDFYLSRKINQGSRVIIVSGCARGADQLGERYAQERGLEVLRFPANWDKYGKRAGYLRNKSMADVANACIAFLDPDAENVGTKMMIRIAREQKLLVREVKEDNGENDE